MVDRRLRPRLHRLLVAASPLALLVASGCDGEPCDDVVEDCGAGDRCVPGVDPVETPASHELRDHYVRLDLVYEGCADDELAIWWSGIAAPSDPPSVPLELQHHRGECSTPVSRSVWVDLWELHSVSRSWMSVSFVMGTGELYNEGGETIVFFPYEYEGPQVAPPDDEVIAIDRACGLIQV